MWLDSYQFSFFSSFFFFLLSFFVPTFHGTSSRPSEQVWLAGRTTNRSIMGSCKSGHRRVTQSNPATPFPPPPFVETDNAIQGQQPHRTILNSCPPRKWDTDASKAGDALWNVQWNVSSERCHRPKPRFWDVCSRFHRYSVTPSFGSLRLPLLLAVPHLFRA